jgi:hypothetical protein
MNRRNSMGKRWHVLQDGTVVASTATREQAVDLIRMYQDEEKRRHQWLHANFSMIYGEEELVAYE